VFLGIAGGGEVIFRNGDRRNGVLYGLDWSGLRLTANRFFADCRVMVLSASVTVVR
jgi:hypothetical protein